MNAPVSQELLAPALVEFKLNDQTVVGFEGESILNAAKRHGIAIPHLCYKEGMRADGNCRACVVEILGERTLAPSCCRNVTPGLEVLSNSLRAKQSQKMVLELLLSDMPEQGYKWTKDGQHGELSDWVRKMDVAVRPALQALKRLQPASDMSHPAMAVNLDACIQCKRCVTACREEQVNDVIAYAHRGSHSQIVFDLQDDMGNSTCVACGECVQACPTGALMPKSQVGSQVVDQKVDSVCPFCGVGCLLTYNIKDNKIVSVDGRDGPANHNRLCVKGRFGFDYIQHPQRLTTPLIRKPGVPKDPALIQQLNRNGADWAAVFREATWEEALALGAGKLKQLRDAFGPKSSKSWYALALGPTTLTIARACAMPPVCPLC
jgi:formate dehydrogenase major subunit